MKDHVLTISQMHKLIDMGIDASKASMCWIGCADGNGVYPYDKTWKKCFEEHINTMPTVLTPTFTLQDILVMLPNEIVVYTNTYNLELLPNNAVIYARYDSNGEFEEYVVKPNFKSSLIESAFNMLKWCKENNYI